MPVMIVVIQGVRNRGWIFGDDLGQQAVAGHRVEDPRLGQKHHQDDRAQAGDRPELDRARRATHVHRVDGHGDRVGNVELLVVHDAGHDEAGQAVEDRADRQRADDADRHVALGVLGLLGGGRDRVEADVGEEDQACPAEDAAPAVLEVEPGALGGRDERPPQLAGSTMRQTQQDEQDDDRHLDRPRSRC